MEIKTAFINRLKQSDPLLLDGGLSNQLESQGADLDHPLWSALLLQQQPEQIIKAHRHYLQAGAQCLISASYQASVSGFAQLGLNSTQAEALICLSVELAFQAIEEFNQEQPQPKHSALVAASIGPYGACLADGSEYHGNYGVGDDVLVEFHQQRLRLLDRSKADVLACETIPSLQEGRVLKQLLEQVNTPAWISFACRNGQQLNDGSSIIDAVKLFADHPKVVAIGINCTAPQYISELIKQIANNCNDKAIIVYPNSGECYNPDDNSWHGQSDTVKAAQAAKGWFTDGAKIIGGCCRMGPEHIRAMQQALKISP